MFNINILKKFAVKVKSARDINNQAEKTNRNNFKEVKCVPKKIIFSKKSNILKINLQKIRINKLLIILIITRISYYVV